MAMATTVGRPALVMTMSLGLVGFGRSRVVTFAQQFLSVDQAAAGVRF